MPFIRSLASMRYILLAIFISLNSKIMSLYSYYAKKGLVCVTIIILFSYQPSFYLAVGMGQKDINNTNKIRIYIC